MKITARDKKLLFVLLLIIICAATYFLGISPIMQEIADNEKKLASLKSQQDEYHNSMKGSGTIDEDIATQQQIKDDNVGVVPPALNKDAAEGYLAEMINDYGFDKMGMTHSELRRATLTVEEDGDKKTMITWQTTLTFSASSRGELARIIDKIEVYEFTSVSNIQYNRDESGVLNARLTVDFITANTSNRN